MSVCPAESVIVVEPGLAEAIRAAGFTDVICNRPDEEVSPDLAASAVEAALAAGLHVDQADRVQAGFGDVDGELVIVLGVFGEGGGIKPDVGPEDLRESVAGILADKEGEIVVVVHIDAGSIDGDAELAHFTGKCTGKADDSGL